MKFTIVERKMKIDDDLRQYALRKVEKLDRYFRQDSDATLTFSELRGKQTVEITVRQGALVVRAEETTSDMFASIDGAISSIERQIRKHKTRLEKRLREGAFDKMAEQQAALAEEEFDVVRRKRFQVLAVSATHLQKAGTPSFAGHLHNNLPQKVDEPPFSLARNTPVHSLSFKL